MALHGATHAGFRLEQGIANLVAVGLERARGARSAPIRSKRRGESEQLRTTLIDAMAHEFKTPLTLIKAAPLHCWRIRTPTESRQEQLTIADEEAEHLRELIDDAIEMARLDTARIELHPEMANLHDTFEDVLVSMRTEIDEHPVRIL